MGWSCVGVFFSDSGVGIVLCPTFFKGERELRSTGDIVRFGSDRSESNGENVNVVSTGKEEVGDDSGDIRRKTSASPSSCSAAARLPSLSLGSDCDCLWGRRSGSSAGSVSACISVLSMAVLTCSDITAVNLEGSSTSGPAWEAELANASLSSGEEGGLRA